MASQALDRISAVDPELAHQLLTQNILNDFAGAGIMWTRVNVGEAIPGTITPLNADFQRLGNEVASAKLFHRLGLEPKPRTIMVGGASLNAFILGKAAINVDYLRRQMDRMPGTSGDQFERSILGSVRKGVESTIDRSRYPHAFLSLLRLIKVLPPENERLGRETDSWWRQSLVTVASADFASALAIFHNARERYTAIVSHAGLVATFSPAVVNQVAVPLGKLGAEDALLTVVAGYGNVKETAMLERLWRVAKGLEDKQTFLADFGYMCANAGELESRTWREDPSALDAVIAGHAVSVEDGSPAHRLNAVMRKARAKQEELLGRAGLLTRQQLKMGFWLARRLLPIREVGKACMFQASDIARAAARRMGRLLADADAIGSPEDIFYLSLEEIGRVADGAGLDLKASSTRNRKLRAAYAAIELPDFFTSEELPQIVLRQLAADQPSKATSSAEAQAGHIVRGAAASVGKVTGTARIITDPSRTDGFAVGEILVCKVTDPGWSALFSIAGALVTDIGGMLSHSAIIARELGIPAVVGTKQGTRLIADGATVTVDGAAGTIEIHSDGAQP